MNIDVKRLAQLTNEKGKVDRKVESFVLTKLSRKELIEYARHLKALADKNTVRIQSQSPIPEALKKQLTRRFSDKNVIFETEQVGEGVRVIVNDTVIDLTLDGLIASTIENLKVD